MIRFGYDAERLFTNRTGLGNYSRNLLNNLSYYYPDNAYFLYASRIPRNSETRFFLNSPLFQVYSPKGLNRLFWRNHRILNDLQRQKIHLFHGLTNVLPSGIDKTRIKSVVTIHDLVYKRHPEFHSLAERLVLDSRFQHACARANRIVATSENTRRDILEFFDVKPEKVNVVYQTCAERFMQEKAPKLIEAVLQKYRLPSEYLLHVGAITERKNLMGVIQAMAQLPYDLRLPLVVVGTSTAYKLKIQSYLLRHRLLDQVFFIIPNPADLPAIYQKAAVFIYPSFYEGFGIPVLEALFSRTPVVTSKVSSLPEVAGPGAWLADPKQPEDINAGIIHLLTDTAARNEAVEKGYQYAQQFRAEPLTERMMEVYEEVLEGQFG